MKVRLLAGLIAVLAVLAGTATAASAHTKRPAAHYYLALGDSLSVGFQPNGAGIGGETKQGYVNDIYAVARKHFKNLKLVQLGCPGDTTTSMLTGQGNDANAKLFHCDRAHGRQLAAAVAFLKAHKQRGAVPLVTIDIGANDVDSCAADLNTVATCIANGEKTIQTNLPKILDAIRSAAPKGAALSGMNLYDPLLAEELSSDPTQAALGAESTQFVKQINAILSGDDSASHFRTADVADAFQTYNTAPVPTAGTPLAGSGKATVPTDVAKICSLTWMCAPAPVGPNIHANAAGYQAIAGAFAQVLGKQF